MKNLNIRCTSMVQKPSHIWMLYFEGLQSQHYDISDCLHPPLQAALPPWIAAEPSPIWKRTLLWLITISMLKSKGKNRMVEEPSHRINQLSVNHVCNIGLNTKMLLHSTSTIVQYCCSRVPCIYKCNAGLLSNWIFQFHDKLSTNLIIWRIFYEILWYWLCLLKVCKSMGYMKLLPSTNQQETST